MADQVQISLVSVLAAPEFVRLESGRSRGPFGSWSASLARGGRFAGAGRVHYRGPARHGLALREPPPRRCRTVRTEESGAWPGWPPQTAAFATCWVAAAAKAAAPVSDRVTAPAGWGDPRHSGRKVARNSARGLPAAVLAHSTSTRGTSSRDRPASASEHAANVLPRWELTARRPLGDDSEGALPALPLQKSRMPCGSGGEAAGAPPDLSSLGVYVTVLERQVRP